MIQLTLNELFDTFERHYQYKHPKTGQLVNFKCLTEMDGEVYIEYMIGRRQYNLWVSLVDPNIYKRVVSIEDLVEYVTPDNSNPEHNWGKPMGDEYW